MSKSKPKLYGLCVPLKMIDDSIDVIYGCPKLAKKRANAPEIPDYVDGFSHQEDDGNTWLYIGKTNKDYGLIAHEALHAIRQIFERRNIPFRADCDEMIAYPLGYIVEQVTTAKKWYEMNEKTMQFNKKPK